MSAIGASLPVEDAQDAEVRPRSTLYRSVWRWHFYAGILAIPVIVILALTGIVYLFKPQIEAVMYGDMSSVERGTSTVSYDDQFAAAQARHPEWPVIAMEPAAGPNSATRFHLDNGGTGGFEPAGQTVFVNPYTGEVEGTRNNAYNPAQIALQIHGYLMTTNWLGDEKWGDHFLELIAGWTIVLIVTGIFLWWPRGRAGKSLRGTIVPRLNLRPSRVAFRDVHAITGVVFAAVFLFFLITGLMWTDVWGGKYSEVAARYNSYPEVNTESSHGTHEETTIEEQLGEGSTSWAQSAGPAFVSAERANGTATSADGRLEWNAQEGAPLQAVVDRVEASGMTPGYVLYWPEDEDGSYQAARWYDLGSKPNQSALDEKFVYVDQYTAEELGSYTFADYGVMAKTVDWGISLHEGREWGIWSQLAALVGTLAILVSAVTAVVMWFKRKPEGLGAPRRVYSTSALLGLVVITFTLGIFFPLVGISLIALAIFDFFILRRIPPLARFFGVSGPASETA